MEQAGELAGNKSNVVAIEFSLSLESHVRIQAIGATRVRAHSLMASGA
jgi:hypothetical protein